MVRLVFDTSTLLAFFKGEEEAPYVKLLLQKCEEGEFEGIISTLLMAEAYYILARRDVEKAEERFNQLDRSALVKYDVDRNIAKKIGELKSRYGGVSIVDCTIAATALVADAQCVIVSEKDIKHFKEIKEINTRTPREGAK